MVRVQIRVEVQGRGTTKAWWGRFPGLAEAGEGSDRRVVTTGEPSWLPRIKDGEAWIDLQPGTVIRAGVTHFGGYRRAQVSSPPLIVEEGREWTAVDREFQSLIGRLQTGILCGIWAPLLQVFQSLIGRLQTL